MAEIGLQCAGIDALVGEAVAAGMPEHVGVDLEANLGFATENDRRAYVRSALCGNAPAHAEHKSPSQAEVPTGAERSFAVVFRFRLTAQRELISDQTDQ